EVLVEGGQLDDADAALGRIATAGNRHRLALGGLFGQPHLLPGQRDHAVLAVQAFGGGDVFQPHLGVLGAADLGHHVVDAPADHVLDRAGPALADADDAVARLQRAVHRGRAAGDDL